MTDLSRELRAATRRALDDAEASARAFDPGSESNLRQIQELHVLAGRIETEAAVTRARDDFAEVVIADMARTYHLQAEPIPERPANWDAMSEAAQDRHASDLARTRYMRACAYADDVTRNFRLQRNAITLPEVSP